MKAKKQYNIYNSEQKKLIYVVYKYFNSRKNVFKNCFKLTQDIFDISRNTLLRLIKNTNFHRKKSNHNPKLNDFQKDVIKRTVYGYFERNETLTMKRLKILLDEKHDIVASKYTLLKVMHGFGFKYKNKGESREVLCERRDLVQERAKFLRAVREKRAHGHCIVYTVETWLNAAHTTSFQWPDDKLDRNIPPGRGQRLIVLHAGCVAKGFLDNCNLVFKSKSTDNRDYHHKMNGDVYLQWVKDQLIPALPAKSVVVMDNAPYHSMIHPEHKAPTSSSRKAVLQDWLANKNIKFNARMKKPELYELVKRNKTEPVYQVDTLIRKAGHDVLRLPPYHCQFNAIELIWANLKNRIAIENKTFKLDDIRTMIADGFQRIDQSAWSKCVDHVMKIEAQYWASDGLAQNINRVVID